MSNLINFGKRLKSLRTSQGLTQEELARKTGYTSRSSINKIELGLVDLPQSKIAIIAEALGVTPTYLLFGDEGAALPSNIRPVVKKKFRMLGEIACGKPIYASEDFETYVEAASDINADFCLTARGDSMIGARIHDGDVVFIKEQPIVENGQIAAVIIDDEATLKRWYYYPDKNKLVLNPENPKYEPLVYVGEELNTIRCLGRAVCFMSKV
ncbi:MAG: helix-turn-helix domain-containing protein [Clostridia bacterium]|nr:helix-turn-helix domain-containing protein [Clostridia bacterium]